MLDIPLHHPHHRERKEAFQQKEKNVYNCSLFLQILLRYEKSGNIIVMRAGNEVPCSRLISSGRLYWSNRYRWFRIKIHLGLCHYWNPFRVVSWYSERLRSHWKETMESLLCEQIRDSQFIFDQFGCLIDFYHFYLLQFYEKLYIIIEEKYTLEEINLQNWLIVPCTYIVH